MKNFSWLAQYLFKINKINVLYKLKRLCKNVD